MSRQSVRKALNAEAVRIGVVLAEGNPTLAFKQATAFMNDLQQWESQVAEIRRAAVREAYENYGWSYTDIANEFGISRQRAQEIVGA